MHKGLENMEKIFGLIRLRIMKNFYLRDLLLF